MSLSTFRSLIRSRKQSSTRSNPSRSKKLSMSASTTQIRPARTASRIACKAWCAERLGRNPNEQGRKSASTIGSMTILMACWTTRSRTAAMPKGRRLAVPGLGIHTLRTGCGRYVLARSCAASSSSICSTPAAWICPMVTASTPGAPWLARTSNHARRSTSPRRIRSYNAWKRRFGDRLAARYSLCCRTRVLSRVLLGLTAMHRLLPACKHGRSRGPWLRRVMLSTPLGYYDPLRRPPGSVRLPG